MIVPGRLIVHDSCYCKLVRPNGAFRTILFAELEYVRFFSVVPYRINNEYMEKCENIVCNEHFFAAKIWDVQMQWQTF